ncbi:hypothetical protein GCM10027348_14060 [Hymenobacter tenuis]
MPEDNQQILIRTVDPPIYVAGRFEKLDMIVVGPGRFTRDGGPQYVRFNEVAYWTPIYEPK